MEKIPRQTHFTGLKIVLYGPESTGKSTLAQQLAVHFKTVKVDEYARDYLQEKYVLTGEICEYKDLLPIAIGQRLAENKAVTTAVEYLFCDTDVLETYMYANIYFNKAPLELKEAVIKSNYDLYLLLDVDVAWVADDLRDRPDDRKELFYLFKKGLQDFKKKYIVINGVGNERFKNAIDAIKNLNNK
jgi:NadR type nicotinamide-nucleotide adenylyltransferase